MQGQRGHIRRRKSSFVHCKTYPSRGDHIEPFVEYYIFTSLFSFIVMNSLILFPSSSIILLVFGCRGQIRNYKAKLCLPILLSLGYLDFFRMVLPYYGYNIIYRRIHAKTQIEISIPLYSGVPVSIFYCLPCYMYQI